METWILVRNGEVRDGFSHPPIVTDADEDALVDAKRRLVFGADDDGEAPLGPEGEWVVLASGVEWGAGWSYANGTCAPPLPTLADYGRAVNQHVHSVARSRGYDDGVSLASYDNDPNPTFAGEAAAFKAWRSAVWVAAALRLAEVQGGGAVPSMAELVEGLPAIVWPA